MHGTGKLTHFLYPFHAFRNTTKTAASRFFRFSQVLGLPVIVQQTAIIACGTSSLIHVPSNMGQKDVIVAQLQAQGLPSVDSKEILEILQA